MLSYLDDVVLFVFVVFMLSQWGLREWRVYALYILLLAYGAANYAEGRFKEPRLEVSHASGD